MLPDPTVQLIVPMTEPRLAVPQPIVIETGTFSDAAVASWVRRLEAGPVSTPLPQPTSDTVFVFPATVIGTWKVAVCLEESVTDNDSFTDPFVAPAP
jgi:hypothetical protein